MSTGKWQKHAMLAVFGLACLASAARAETIAPYKDELFAYPGVLATADGGDFLTVDYQELRDINKRDQEPERRARGKYVSLGVRKAQAMETLTTAEGTIDLFRAGAMENARFAVIFVHGRGGDRRLGANDWSFGGNFNRLKNLAVDNGGVYLAPTVKSFDEAGLARLRALTLYLRTASPEGRIVLACASMGSILCWQAINDKAMAPELAGMMVMGGVPAPDLPKSLAGKRKMPLFMSHGSADVVYPASDQQARYQAFRDKAYPVRFVLFNTGSHGTPVRMTDWRDALNWILDR